MIAADIATALGGAHRCGAWWRCHCPVHNSRGTTLALRDGEDGLIVKCHAGCRREDILAALRQLGLMGDVPDPSAKSPDPAAIGRWRAAEERDRQRRITAALDLWHHETAPPD